MEKKEYVTYGCKRGCPCAGDHAITGCRFTLSPMSDRFIEIILGAVGKTDTSKVWSRTDEVSTIYRGKRVHVLDALKACFTGAFTEGVHMALEATVSKGCPGDVEADSFMAEDDEPVNERRRGRSIFRSFASSRCIRWALKTIWNISHMLSTTRSIWGFMIIQPIMSPY